MKLLCCVFILVVLLVHGVLLDAVQEPPKVATPLGDIIGVRKNASVHGKSGQVDVFMGIPYAESPVGNLRLKKPVPKANFTSPFDARRRISCYQFPNDFGLTGEDNDITTEDCLIQNIFVPQTVTVGPKSVMVWIHGGGFIFGSSLFYNGENLALCGDVIVVTINYRLAVYVFLSTGDSSSRGNYGLWDQYLAIKWVHANIRSFGGDPAQVTISGQSAGSASVIFQALYPGNKGLCQRAIAESGTALSFWSLNFEPEQMAGLFATKAGCSAADWQTKCTCLRAKTSEEMNATLSEIPLAGGFSDYAWLPVVDGEFVVGDPRIIYSNCQDTALDVTFNNIDLVIGVTTLDGLVFASTIQAQLNVTLNDITRSQYEQYLLTLVDAFTKTKNPKIVGDASQARSWECPAFR